MTGLIFLQIFGLLVATRPVFWADTVEEGTRIKATFEIVDTSKDSAYIIGVRKGCMCENVRYDKKALAPEDTLYLTVEVNTTGYSGFLRRWITLYYRDPEGKREELNLTIEGWVIDRLYNENEVRDIMVSVIYDIRPKKLYKNCHLIGSVYIQPQKLLKFISEKKLKLRPGTYIIIVSQDTMEGFKILEAFKQAGYHNVHVFLPQDFKKWRQLFKKENLICGQD